MSTKKKKPAVSPEAAKILEQYRNAGKSRPGADGEGVEPASDGAGPARPVAPPHRATIQRSGNRGK